MQRKQYPFFEETEQKSFGFRSVSCLSAMFVLKYKRFELIRHYHKEGAKI